MTAALPTALAAAILAVSAALFGVTMARAIWADDLKHAQRIDAIRSDTQKQMQRQIDALRETIDIYKKRLGE